MRKFASIMLPLLSSTMLFGAILLKLDNQYFLGIELDVFFGVAGLSGLILSVINTIVGQQRYRREKYPELRLNIFTQRKKEDGGKTMLFINALAIGFGDAPELDNPKIIFENGELNSFLLTKPPVISKGGKQHSYFISEMPNGHTNAIACYMYSYVTQRGYFSQNFPRSHRLYKLGNRYEPPIITGEFETDLPGHQLNGEDLRWAQHFQYDDQKLLFRREIIQRWFGKIFLHKKYDQLPPL